MASSGLILNSQAGTTLAGSVYATGIVPAVSVAQGGTPVLAAFNVYIPVAGSTAVTLPPSAPAGTRVVILNLAATAVTLLVFPNLSTGKIGSGAAAASFSVAQNKAAEFINHDGLDNWIPILSA